MDDDKKEWKHLGTVLDRAADRLLKGFGLTAVSGFLFEASIRTMTHADLLFVVLGFLINSAATMVFAFSSWFVMIGLVQVQMIILPGYSRTKKRLVGAITSLFFSLVVGGVAYDLAQQVMDKSQ